MNITGSAELVLHHLEEVAEGDAAVDVRAEDVEPLASPAAMMSMYCRSPLAIATGRSGSRALIARDDFAEERVEVARLGGVALALRAAPRSPPTSR